MGSRSVTHQFYPRESGGLRLRLVPANVRLTLWIDSSDLTAVGVYAGAGAGSSEGLAAAPNPDATCRTVPRR